MGSGISCISWMAPNHQKHHALLSWSDDVDRRTARQLFELLDTDGDGLVSVEEIVRQWPSDPCHPSCDEAELTSMLQRLALQSEQHGHRRGHLAWGEFRKVVRLWRSTESHSPPRCRRYLIQSATEASAALVAALCAAEASCMLHTVSAEVSVQLAALGGMGLVLSLLPLDSSSVRPVLADVGPAEIVNLGPHARRGLFLAAAFSCGGLLAPSVPILAALVGDPQTQGHGPVALASVAVAHWAGQIAGLAVVPESWLEEKETGGPAEPASAAAGRVAAVAALSGGLAAATACLAVTQAANRLGARRPALVASAFLSAHSAATVALANYFHKRGEPEPLRPFLAPMLKLLQLLSIPLT